MTSEIMRRILHNKEWEYFNDLTGIQTQPLPGLGSTSISRSKGDIIFASATRDTLHANAVRWPDSISTGREQRSGEPPIRIEWRFPHG